MLQTGVTGTQLVGPTITYDPLMIDVVIRLADEGIPIRAIARATKISSADIREFLDEALEDGRLLQIPRDDWPVNTSRDARAPGSIKLAVDDNDANLHLVQLLNLTRLESAMLLALVKRRQCTREVMHQIIESCRSVANKIPTDQKMVDVMICKLRKKLDQHKIEIVTIWSLGYFMPPDHRRRIEEMLKTQAEKNERLLTGVGA